MRSAVTSAVTESLEADATRALVRVRGAFGAIVDSLSGAGSRPYQLRKSLGIDRKLAWRIAKVIHEPDILSATRHLPGMPGVDIFLAAAEEKHVARKLIESAREAVRGFHAVIDAHAGERGALELMLAASSPQGRRDAAHAQQKAAYAANSFIWGAQAQVQVATYFLHPAPEDDRVDIAAVRGFVSLRRIKPNVPWLIGRVGCVDDDGQVRRDLRLEPIDPQPERSDDLPPTPLMREFCSAPLPEVRRMRADPPYLEDELIEAPVGNRGLITCLTGEVARAVAPRYRDEHNQQGSLNVRVRTPVKLLLFDVFMHKDLASSDRVALFVYGDLGGPRETVFRPERDKLDHYGTTHRLGRERAAAYTPHVPRYVQMTDHVCDRLGWQRGDFVLNRSLLEFPVMPSSVVVRWPLPDREQTFDGELRSGPPAGS